MFSPLKLLKEADLSLRVNAAAEAIPFTALKQVRNTITVSKNMMIIIIRAVCLTALCRSKILIAF